MNALLLSAVPPVAALGYSIIYLIFGGSLVGALFVFIVAKIFHK